MVPRSDDHLKFQLVYNKMLELPLSAGDDRDGNEHVVRVWKIL